jgi:hypothetical protein
MARPSLRVAIDRMCRECIFDRNEPGNWRQQVGECTSNGCPLHPVRPQSTEPIIPTSERATWANSGPVKPSE